MYAKEVIKGRWLEVEPKLMKDPYRAYTYARYVIKDRWIEAEPYIRQDDWAWEQYQLCLLPEQNH